MKYLFLLRGDAAEWDAQSAEFQSAALAAHDRLGHELEAADALDVTYRLQPPTEGVTVRPSGDGFTVTDGPFAESKEQVGGFYLVEAESQDQAIAWARKLPLGGGGCDSTEVRPAMTGATWRGPLQGKHKYMLMLIGNRETLARQSPAEVFPVVDHHYEYSLELAAQGRFVASRSLFPAEAARTLRAEEGEAIVSDGPYAESKEVVAGFFIVACDSREEAIQAAGELLQGLEAVEVRPVWEAPY